MNILRSLSSLKISCCAPVIGSNWFRNFTSFNKSLVSVNEQTFINGIFKQPVNRMATLNQMHRKGKPEPKRKRNHPLEGNPMLKGVVLKTMIKKPKKPNSANRKCVRVKLSTGREVTAYIPGEGHNLQEHNIVLVRGGNVQDLPGVKLKCIRGKYDLPHVIKRTP